MAVFAPIPRASERIAAIENRGDLTRPPMIVRRLFMAAPICVNDEIFCSDVHSIGWFVKLRVKTLQERRLEPRLDIDATVTMTPLGDVSKRLSGSIVNISGRGVRVRLSERPSVLPRTGDVFRVQCGDDLMLCELRRVQTEGADLDYGFQIVYWVNVGDLNRQIKTTNAAYYPK